MYCCHRRRQHRGVRTTRLCRTLSRRSLSALPASTATRPTFVTIMIRPSERDGMATDMPLFRPSGKAKYFLFLLIFGLTRFPKIGSVLPVGLICRRRNGILSLPQVPVNTGRDGAAAEIMLVSTRYIGRSDI